MKPLFSPAEKSFAACAAAIDYCNPFVARRIELEKAALGDEFLHADSGWNMRADSGGHHPNITRMTRRASDLLDELRRRLADDPKRSRADLSLYEDVAFFVLYHRYYDAFNDLISDSHAQPPAKPKAAFYARFLADFTTYMKIPRVELPGSEEAPNLFAILFQIRRAFFHIFNHIVGSSQPACRLRAAVWESIFTHDMGRYRRSLHGRMGDITTLITGPSGTGKELVARAIGLTRYIPFDPKTRAFTEDFASSFHPLNLSALSSTLIESELFGHRRGSFTGALDDRVGWLELCKPLGCVFLDEIGEIDSLLQVKLLRVLQSRTFQRLGETATRDFRGKIIAATNRDLAREIRTGRFREDFYYRLCSDMVSTPSLHEQLRECPEDRRRLVQFIARRIAEDEADALSREVEQWIESNLPRDYAWPGNFRELEQCVRNVMIRRAYQPRKAADDATGDAFLDDVSAGRLTVDQLLRQYITRSYARTGSYEETARQLGIDRRTVKAKIDAKPAEPMRTGEQWR